MRLNFSCSTLASVLISSVLASPGTPTSRQWPREDCRQQQLDHRFLADDDLVQFGQHRLSDGDELRDKLRLAGNGLRYLNLGQSILLGLGDDHKNKLRELIRPRGGRLNEYSRLSRDQRNNLKNIACRIPGKCRWQFLEGSSRNVGNN